MPPSLLEILRRTTEYFSKAGLEKPRLEAEWLLAAALGCQRLELYLQFERPLDTALLDRLRPMVARRARREPLQYILGEVDFHALTLKIDRRALIPRPETEALVALLVETVFAAKPPTAVLDLGTGSGAIALALAKAWPSARVVAVERSPEALALATENAAHTGLAARVEWRAGDWFGPVRGERFELVVSNPPYLSVEEVEAAAPEVRVYEPHPALVSPEEGLRDLRHLLGGARAHLSPGGCLALETGLGQHATLAAEASRLGYARHESRRDPHERERYFFVWTAAGGD
jgi:release factor glutamine methyltransferase